MAPGTEEEGEAVPYARAASRGPSEDGEVREGAGTSQVAHRKAARDSCRGPATLGRRATEARSFRPDRLAPLCPEDVARLCRQAGGPEQPGVWASILVALSQVMPAASPDSNFVGLAEEQDAEVTPVGDSRASSPSAGPLALAREADRMGCSGRSLPRWPARMGQGRSVVSGSRRGERGSHTLQLWVARFAEGAGVSATRVEWVLEGLQTLRMCLSFIRLVNVYTG